VTRRDNMEHSSKDTSDLLIAGKLPGALLQRLIEKHIRLDDSVLIGPEVGADAAALRSASSVIVVKSDPITFPTPDIARYLVNVNANDVVCMGARPRWMLVTALLPAGETTSTMVEDIFAQLTLACSELSIALVGGHTEITHSVRSPILVGMLIGEAEEASLLDLRRAQAGDELILCNSVAIEGTAILANEFRDRLVDQIPQEVIEGAQLLTDSPGLSVVPAAYGLRESGVKIRGMHDPTEGGIATAIWEVARVTNCDIHLSLPIPVRDDTIAICRALDLDPLGLIASGALLAVVEGNSASRATEYLASIGIAATRLGRLATRQTESPAVTQFGGEQLPVFKTDEIARFFSSLQSD
jgi:hydrogenase expression/formation protein HypE